MKYVGYIFVDEVAIEIENEKLEISMHMHIEGKKEEIEFKLPSKIYVIDGLGKPLKNEI